MSILESQLVKPTRPYSKNELLYIRERLKKHLFLSNNEVYHTKCGHFYMVKKNSNKEKEMLSTNTKSDVGNCSVCWKLYNTPRELKEKAKDVVEAYRDAFQYDNFKEDNFLYDYYLFDLENVFYRWLYDNTGRT